MRDCISLAVVLCGMLAVIAGCASSDDGPSTPGATMPTIKMLTGEWALIELQGQDVEPLVRAARLAQEPSMTIEADGRIGGFAGVNRWFSQLDLEAFSRGQWASGPIGSTRMAGPEEAIAIEDRYLASIRDAAKLEFEHGSHEHLILLSQSGDTLLRFKRAQ